jgi:hypothetical protein
MGAKVRAQNAAFDAVFRAAPQFGSTSRTSRSRYIWQRALALTRTLGPLSSDTEVPRCDVNSISKFALLLLADLVSIFQSKNDPETGS